MYKLHEATGISEPFRHLDSVLMKERKDLHRRTKHYYASFAKQGVRPVLESIAPGQGKELWNYLKNSSIPGLGNSDNAVMKMEKFLLTPSRTTLYEILLMPITMHSLQNREKKFCQYLLKILRESN